MAIGAGAAHSRMAVKQEHLQEGSQAELRTDESLLLDNAKVVAICMVVFADLLQPCLSTLAAGTDTHCKTWWDAEGGLATATAYVANAVGTPLFCFVSGVCSQGLVTAERMQHFIKRLVIPTALWAFLMKPLIIACMTAGSASSLVANVASAMSLQVIAPE
eukprot:2297332-Amphidinium_carterae.1